MQNSQIQYLQCILEFEVKRKHFFKDRKYTLYLLPDKLVMSEKQQQRNPKYVLNLDPSLTVRWIFGSSEKLIGFWIPYKGRLKDIYGPSEGLQKFLSLVRGRVFFEGEYFNKIYTFVSEISKGQFGKVRKYKKVDGQFYAVKIIDKKTTVKQKNGIDALLNEIMIMIKANHPLIVKLYEIYQDQNNFYLVMQYIDGVTLRQELQQSNIPLERSQQLFKQILEALCYLHTMKIIHRDIKPSNIMVSKNDKIIVIDLGLSCFVGEQQRILPDCGTIGYMAPELFNRHEYDCKADIFSAGCVLYRMLTGKPAFNGKNESETFKLNKSGFVDITPYLNKGSSSQIYDFLGLLLDVCPLNRMSAEESLQMFDASQHQIKEFISKRRKKSGSRENSERKLSIDKLEKEKCKQEEKRIQIKSQSLKGSQKRGSLQQSQLQQAQQGLQNDLSANLRQNSQEWSHKQQQQYQESPLREQMIEVSTSQAQKTVLSLVSQTIEPKAKKPPPSQFQSKSLITRKQK